MKYKIIALLILAASMTACSGIRRSGDQFTTHAEAFNLLGLQIPEDDYMAAMKHVPAGAEIHTVGASPNDWTSVLGGLGKILGFSQTQISGKVSR